MIQAVSMRWNTTAELIGKAKDLHPALNLLINREQHNKSHGVQLKHFQLWQQEWDLLLQLYLLLDVSFFPSSCYSMLMLSYQVFLEATKKMSQSQVPLLHEVIPLFDIIMHHIDKYIENTENFPEVHAAA